MRKIAVFMRQLQKINYLNRIAKLHLIIEYGNEAEMTTIETNGTVLIRPVQIARRPAYKVKGSSTRAIFCRLSCNTLFVVGQLTAQHIYRCKLNQKSSHWLACMLRSKLLHDKCVPRRKSLVCRSPRRDQFSF